MIAVEESILEFTVGEVIHSSSKYIGIAFPTIFSVASANFCFPSSLKLSTTCGVPIPVLSTASSLYFADWMSSPFNNTLLSESLNSTTAVLSSPSIAARGSTDVSLVSVGISTLIWFVLESTLII